MSYDGANLSFYSDTYKYWVEKVQAVNGKKYRENDEFNEEYENSQKLRQENFCPLCETMFAQRAKILHRVDKELNPLLLGPPIEAIDGV